MTAQQPEVLIYNGKQLEMISLPDLNGKLTPGFGSSTNLYRGYIGIWEIKDNKLYLNGRKESGFMKEPGPIFADWVSQELHVWVGNVLEYKHAGFGSTYEEDWFFLIENGILQSIRTVNNIESYKQKAIDEINSATTKPVLARLYNKYLNPNKEFNTLSWLIDQSTGYRWQDYVQFQKDLEFDFKQRLIVLADDPNSGITLAYK